MQVSQVAYDRYVVDLPPADADWRPLADPETLAETAAWLWQFGPTPLVAVVGTEKTIPSWLTNITRIDRGFLASPDQSVTSLLDQFTSVMKGDIDDPNEHSSNVDVDYAKLSLRE